jgi:D-serine deaminase-like pyridoxal phosphate-dependent protein
MTSAPSFTDAGCVQSTVATPALVVDPDIVRRNINRLAGYAATHGLGIRPHTKTHKSRMLARLQLEAGAVGLAVAKAGEAEQMMPVCDDVLIAYPAVDPARVQRIAELARAKTVRVAIDSVFAIEALAGAASAAGSTIGVMVEMDVGLGRTGVSTAAEALALAKHIDRTSGVRLDGIMCYPGHISGPADQQTRDLSAVAEKLRETIDLWRGHGLEAKIVSGGSTPTAYQSHLVRAYTEIRPGTYIFNDMNTVRRGHCKLEDCAARIICTVVSSAVKNQVVLDGGSKTFASDLCLPAPRSGHGHIVEYPQATITVLSEEHGQVDVSLCEKRPAVGERVSVIPNHICPCVNLQDSFWWAENDSPQLVSVDARGKLS